MKKISFFLSLILTFSLLLCSCVTDNGNKSDTTVNRDTTVSDISVIPDGVEAKHEIAISEIKSILAGNGLRTNINKWTTEACAYHGGQQIRVCHTERGTYTAFARDYGDGDGIQKFYVAKIDNAGQVSILYYGGFKADDGTITVNICQDINGNILVTTTSTEVLAVYVFDSETDEMTKHETAPVFSSDEIPGYGQVMFDLDNRKIYLFTASGSWSTEIGDCLFEWFFFDLETMKWSENSTYVWIEDIGRHCYLYPFPDGERGAYIVAERDEKTEIIGKDRFSLSGLDTYVWDRLELFHIPDLAVAGDVTYTTVQYEDDTRGLEGIWSTPGYTHNGDVFVDSNGYMHITYRQMLVDYTGTHTDFDDKSQYRHAVYNGMECIYNEEINVDLADSEYKVMVRQSTDGKLHLIVAKLWGTAIELEFYSTDDDIGRSWKQEKSVTVKDNVRVDSLTLSAVRDGSVQDNILSVFFYGSDGTSVRSGFTFNISLDDYSVTEVINILSEYEFKVDDVRYDKRVPYSDHQPVIVRTENGVYAAFVYNSHLEGDTDSFYIVKADGENGVEVLYSDTFNSSQNKYLTVSAAANGEIYVCPPTGRHAYVIDPETDEVTLRELTPILTNNLMPIQAEIVSVPESNDKYLVTVLEDGSFKSAANIIDPEKLSIVLKNVIRYTPDKELAGKYNGVYTLSDGKNGLYMVGTREIIQRDTDGKLTYSGITSAINDSVMLLYIPDITDNTGIKCIDVQIPYEEEGNEGIWSVVKVNDVYLDSEGKLCILYTYYHYDYDDADIADNPELKKNTLKQYLAVYDGNDIVSREEINVGMSEYDLLRMYETADGELYILACNSNSSDIKVYFRNDGEFVLAFIKALGDFTVDGFFVGSPRNGSVYTEWADCLVFASDNDVYYTRIEFEAKK